MRTLTLPDTNDKQFVFEAIKQYLDELGIDVSSTDFDRPWGGFFVIDEQSIKTFITEFFPGYSLANIGDGLKLTPKILVAAPNSRLSWQYHHRRAEIWSVLHGPIGIITSYTDTQAPVEEKQVGDVVSFGTETRHRLLGLETFGVVAEFWKHTDPDNPSDEDDIVRVQDDFNRAA